MKIVFLAMTLLFSLVTPLSAAALQVSNKQVMELKWLDLIPESDRRQSKTSEVLIEHGATKASQPKIGRVRDELNEKTVRIPGFVIPLEGDSETISELLLVPFYGACIHVPPPPPNQIIHVKFDKAAPIAALWDVVYITGKLKTIPLVSHSFDIESGYSIEDAYLEEYKES